MSAQDDSQGAPPVGVPRPDNAEKWAARLALVSEIARTAHSKLEMRDLLNTVAEAVRRYFGFYDVSVFLVNHEEGQCVLAAQSGAFSAQGVEGYRQRLGVGIVGWVAEHGETIVANDVRTEPRHIVAFDGEEESLSELAVPIRTGGRTVGVINIENREANAFDECDVMALETLSEQIAQAIANAQLFERTRLLRDFNRSIIDAMPSGLCVLDEHINVLYANPSFCALCAVTEGQIAGRPVRDLLPDVLLHDVGIEDAIHCALNEQKSQVFARIAVPFAEVERVLNISVSPAQMPEGLGVLLLFEDLTQWQRAEALAETRLGLLDLIVSHVPVAFVSFDLENKFTYWGKGAERLFGYKDRETVGKATPHDLLEAGSDLQSLLDECASAGSAEGELFLKREDGTSVPVLLVLGKLLDKEERHVGYTAVVLDVTERRLAQEELLREKQKLDDVVSVIGAGLALIDRNSQVIWANRAINEWFGRGRPVEGMICHEVYCNSVKACTICPSRECFATGKNSEVEVALVRADGAMRQYHHAVTPVFGPSGQVEHVLKLTMDVTDQTKKVYQLSRLRQFGELMQGVLDLERLLHFVLTCVSAGQALGFNRAVLFLMDKDRSVIQGEMGVGPGSAEEAAQIWSRISKEAPTLDDLLARYDREKGKEPSAMDLIARRLSVPLDDTSHILVQCALGRKPIVVEDAHMDPRVSDEFRSILGAKQFVMAPLIARDEPVGVILADNLYSGHPITEEHVELLSMFANQAAVAIENAGNYKRLQEDKAHLEQAYRDLADAQDKLVRSERLVAIGRMAAHVAHEIRNPLVTIGGFAKSIQRSAGTGEHKAAHYAKVISSEVRRLENILGRVMDFTKPPRPLLRKAPIGPVIRNTIEQLRPTFRKQNIHVHLSVPDQDVLLLDPDQIKQVFLNLFQNALDVMKDGGDLNISVECETEEATIVVANTGEFIRPEDMPSLFEPFFSTKPGGTGLGLAVSQKIVQDHGGDIRAESTLERGTEFIITLPLGNTPGTGATYPSPG